MRRPERELRLERERAEEIVTAVLNAGYSVGVNDGEETTIKRSTNKTDIFKALWTTDEDVIIAYDKATGKAIGTIYLVYGNGAEDLINDNTESLIARPEEFPKLLDGSVMKHERIKT